MTGEWPKEELDHINLVKGDDRWENLREAKHVENMRNLRGKSNGIVGLKGVGPKRDKYRARIKIEGKEISLGSFDCPAAASFAYQISADKNFGEFARWN
jgi:hypothetical protein